MTQDEYRNEMNDVIYLVSCALNKEVPDAERIRGMDLPRVCKAASRHMLAAACAMALESAGVKDKDFTQAKAKAIRKVALMDREAACLYRKLEEAGIWYMPLKGSVLKEDYPAYGMREMSDRDILFDASRAEDVKSIMEDMGFEPIRFGHGEHDTYQKKPVSNFEMHRELFNYHIRESRFAGNWYADVKALLIPDEGCRFRFHFTREDFYVYMVAHEYKHFSERGTGLRSLADTYVYLTRENPDLSLVAAETDRLGLSEYEAANRSLALHLFGGGELTDADRSMLEYILFSGTYGTIRNVVRREGGTWGYIVSRLTLPRYLMLENYPILKKRPFLYPFVWVYRLVHGFFFKHKKFMFQLKSAFREKKE